MTPMRAMRMVEESFDEDKERSTMTSLSATPSWLLPALLSMVAGSVDVVGFLALGGLFPAHITGNLVVLAAHYTTGRFSHLGPLLAVPVFVATLTSTTLAATAFERRGHSPRRTLLILQLVLLMACLGLWIVLGPWPDANLPGAVLVAMVAVAAMATQNVLGRLYLKGLPTTTAMTGNAEQLVIDLVKLPRSQQSADVVRVGHTLNVTFTCVLAWAAGCVASAALEFRYNLGALALPITLAALAVLADELASETRKVVGNQAHRMNAQSERRNLTN